MTTGSDPATPTSIRCLIVIPCLNERDHIGPLLDQLIRTTADLHRRIVVADGGSSDGTLDIVSAYASVHPAIELCHNPRRLQSAGINRAVELFGADADVLIRIDAHGLYPDDYCHRIIEEAIASGGDSVVIGMRTVGHAPFQAAVAAAQNSRIGTGGSRHRMGARSEWVDHGHHALMRIDAFRTVGGYDEDFSHNEDAELDHRLRAAGYRIRLTTRTGMTYFPRSSPSALFRQYFAYGRGRAQNLLKHRSMPKLRQAIPIFVAPAVACAFLSPLSGWFVLPILAWAFACLVGGIFGAEQADGRKALLAVYAAMLMHLAWSSGFWARLIGVSRWTRTGSAG